MEEIFKPVNDLDGVFESRYSVSNFGRIFDNKSKRFLKLTKHVSGTRMVSLQEPGRRKLRLLAVHRLVAMAFMPDREADQDFVLHRDRDKTNNCVSNLKWANTKEKHEQQMADGLYRPYANRQKLFDHDKEEINRLRNEEGLTAQQIADKFDVSRYTIYNVWSKKQ